MIWIEFLVCGGIIVAAATQLSRYGDVLAEKTGLGRAWIGAILVAGVTSLPEMVSGTAAVTWLEAPNLAAGMAVGSSLFNLALIALMDLAYQPGSILSRAQEGHILSAALGVLLLSLVVVAVLLGPALNGFGVFGFSLVSLSIVVLYGVGARLIALFEQKRLAEVLDRSAEVRQYDQISARRAYGVFLASAAVVVIAAIWLASIGDRLSATTGLSRSFVGNLFLAVSTSLPEIATSLAAVRIGAIDLAISNALGSNLFNVMLLAYYDAVDGPRHFWAALSSANALGAIVAVMMTSVAIVSLVYRASPKTPSRVSWDGYALIAMYLGTVAALYWLA